MMTASARETHRSVKSFCESELCFVGYGQLYCEHYDYLMSRRGNDNKFELGFFRIFDVDQFFLKTFLWLYNQDIYLAFLVTIQH